MGIAGWLLRRPGRRVAVTLLMWAGVAAVLAWRAEPVVWLGVVLGALVPVSLWIAWNGPRVHRGAPRLDFFLAMTPQEFEQAVADLIAPLGYTDIRVVGGANDLGVDVLCRDRKGRRVAIQCKRYGRDNPINSSAVQTFMGGMVVHGADRGIIVTTSTFTGPARTLASDHDIVLIDGAELTRMLAREEVDLERSA